LTSESVAIPHFWRSLEKSSRAAVLFPISGRTLGVGQLREGNLSDGLLAAAEDYARGIGLNHDLISD
jgi:hypothetical protein